MSKPITKYIVSVVLLAKEAAKEVVWALTERGYSLRPWDNDKIIDFYNSDDHFGCGISLLIFADSGKSKEIIDCIVKTNVKYFGIAVFYRNDVVTGQEMKHGNIERVSEPKTPYRD